MKQIEKKQENWWKRGKKQMNNDEQERKKQGNIMKKREQTMKHDETERKNNEQWWNIEKQQWKMMKKREATMKNDEKERKKQWTMMKKIGQNNAKCWKIGEKDEKRKHDEK